MNAIKTSLLGIPLDHNSSYRRGAALAPARIREALFCDSSNMWTENGLDLSTHPGWEDRGDISFHTPDNKMLVIEREVGELLDQSGKVVSVGGDHSITYPIVRAYAKHHDRLQILHLDAHPDLYDDMDGNHFSHASPFARIMEDFPHITLTQVGIRTATGHQREQAERFGVKMIEMKDIDRCYELCMEHPVYLSLDLDCLDPAFAPGVSHHEPGGMTSREVINLLHRFEGPLVGADIVEYNPERDLNGVTGMVAAKLLKEILGRMLTSNSTQV